MGEVVRVLIMDIIAIAAGLEARLRAAVEINKNYAAALGTIKLPGVVMGGGANGATGGIENLLALMTMKAAQDAGVGTSTK